MKYDVIVGRFGAFYVNPGTRGDGLDDNDRACLTPFNTIYSSQVPIMQFTGLKDKNRKEIYEGDLFRCIYERDGHLDHIYEAIWDEANATFRLRRHGNMCPQVQVVQGMSDAARHEVIGNIYENPDLLHKN